jgi:hypothetical protein
VDENARHERRCNEAMRPYERPTLTAAGSFKKLTGLSGHGPRDKLFRHQLL